MSGSGTTLVAWLLHSAAGGSMLLLVALLWLRRCRQPAWRQQIGAWGVAAAILVAILSFGPSWFVLPLLPGGAELSGNPVNGTEAVPALAASHQRSGQQEPECFGQQDIAAHQLALPTHDSDTVLALAPSGEIQGTQPMDSASGLAAAPQGIKPLELSSEKAGARLSTPDHRWRRSLLGALTAAYFVAAALLLLRWLFAHVALWRLLGKSRAAPDEVALLFADMTKHLPRAPRLLISPHLHVPISCGLWRPKVVLPQSLCETESRARLPWIFAHELTHIERRDAWACFLFGLGQVLYFYVPWFWSLRRQIRLCQEYIADAAATQQASNAEDYAQFLISFNAAPAVPLGTTGVSGHSSDLYRRITMLLKSPHAVHKHCPRWLSFSASGALLALAVLVAGVTFQAQAAPSTNAAAAAAPVPQPGKANPLPKKDEPAKKPDPLPFLDGNLDVPPGVDAEKMREQIMKMREEMLKRMQQMQPMQPMQGMGMAGAMGQGGMAFGGFGGGRLGVMLQTPDATLADQLDLPKGKGLVVTHVQADSAAAKAGIKEHDILLEFNGKPVANEASRLIHTMQDMKAGATVDAVVLRKGKKETIKGIVLPEAKQMAQGFGGMPGFQGFNANPMQAVPMVPMAPRLGGEGPGQGFGFGGGLGVQPGMNTHTVITSNFRTGDRFTTRHQEGSLIITVTGTVADGKSKVSQVQIQDGNQTDKYESVDKVPEQYRDKVKNLIESNDKSNTRIELRAAPEDKKP